LPAAYQGLQGAGITVLGFHYQQLVFGIGRLWFHYLSSLGNSAKGSFQAVFF
jgi:hypothetical protein